MAIRTLPEIRDVVSGLAKQYGAERVYLFGSYARGDMTEDSDVDLRIDQGAIHGLRLCDFRLDIQDALGLPVDLLTTGSLDAKFRSFIEDDEVLLYEANAR